MKLKIEIDMSGEAFNGENRDVEIARTLEQLAEDIRCDGLSGPFKFGDSHDNPCGKLEVVE